MEGFSGIQIAITALLSSGLVGGIMTIFSKKVWSPESKNELARIGNEFAQLLLEEARAEREELRRTIDELERVILEKKEALEKLEAIAREKDQVIHMLEDRQMMVARKIREGELVSLDDVFGPKGVPTIFRGVVQEKKKESDNGEGQ